MKKQLVYLYLLISITQSIKAQDPTTNLNKYWHYRYRLINYFMEIGMGKFDVDYPAEGQSIPAMVRNFSSGADECGSGCANGWRIYWYDQGRCLGYYIGTLATEYYLLNEYNLKNPNNIQNTNETVMELFYALHAVFRLDSIGLVTWVNWGNAIHNDIISIGNSTPVFPGAGYMMQDDIPNDFYNDVHPNPPTAITDATYGHYCQSGSGVVGPVSEVVSSYSADAATSQDNYYALLMGLELCVELLPNDINTFYYPDGTQVNFVNQLGYPDLRHMAQQLGTQIIQYIFNCGLVLDYPDGNGIGGACGSGYCEPMEEINSAFFSATNSPNCTYIDRSLCDGFGGWRDASDLCLIADLGCPPPAMNIEMPCELAAMSNDGAGNGTGNPGVNELIESLGNYPTHIGCLLCSNVTYANNYGEDLLFQAVNQVLYPTNNNFGASYLNLCNMLDIINSAPWEGPYSHESQDQNMYPFDYGCCGWGSPNRFIYPPATQSQGGWSAGNYNGLDYMLFYNLYCIMAEWQNSYLSAVTVPSCNSYSCLSSYPGAANCSFGSPIVGSNTPSTAYNYINPYCTPIYVNQLAVASNGGFIIQGGTNSFIDLVPESGYTLTVNPGGYFDASCNQTCCEIPPSSYVYEPDNGSTNGDDMGPVKNTDTLTNSLIGFSNTSNRSQIPRIDTINYQMSSEFASKPNYDAIIAYPNPFQSQTTIEFAVGETTPVSISIYDINNNKIRDAFIGTVYTQGEYAQLFNGSDLTAGTYLFVMTTQNDKKTLKIIKK
jgi:Secretion system C-terminal sorting domain